MSSEKKEIKINEINQSKSSGDSSFNDIKDFKSIEEIKKEANSKINPIEYKSIYDIDSYNNMALIKEKFESNAKDEDKIQFFYNNMYLLTTEDRKSFYEKHIQIFKNSNEQKKFPQTILVQTKPIKEVFKNILELMKTSKCNELQNSLTKENYIYSVPDCFIPLNEGDEDLVFSYLTLNIYRAFCEKRSKPENDQKSLNFFKEEINNFNISEKELSTKKSKKSKNNTDQSLLKAKNINFSDLNLYENNDINYNFKGKNKQAKDKFTGTQIMKYGQKLELFRPIIERYLSKEFEDNRNFYLESMKNNEYYNKIKYVYEIAIDLLLYCLVEFPIQILKESIENFYKYFYEFHSQKKFYLNLLLDTTDSKLYDDHDQEVTDKNILQNKIYTIKFNNKKTIQINPYDYVMEFLCDDIKGTTYEEVIYKMKDIKNFSIQKCSFNTDLFKKKETNESFNDYLKKIMNHEILRKAFNQIENFSNRNYPLDNKELVKQIKGNLLYLPFPTPHLSGLTLKKFGYILININRFYKEINYGNKITRYMKKLYEAAFFIITIIHEINFHYFLVILYQNNHTILKTTPSIFKNNCINKNYKYEDSGDMGEILLSGNPFKSIYINALYNFLTLELWNKYKNNINVDFIKLANEFLELNNVVENKVLKYNDFIRINKFTQCLEEEIENDFMYEN